MYIDGRIVKTEECMANREVWNSKQYCWEQVLVPAKKVYIKQLMTGTVYWAYSFDCKVSKQYPDIVRVDGNEKFYYVGSL